MIFTRPRCSQNNPARGGENPTPLHHPLDFALSHSLAVSLSFWLSLFLALLYPSRRCALTGYFARFELARLSVGSRL